MTFRQVNMYIFGHQIVKIPSNLAYKEYTYKLMFLMVKRQNGNCPALGIVSSTLLLIILDTSKRVRILYTSK